MTLSEIRDELHDAVAALRDQVDGPVALPGEPGYERATPWNVAVAVRPYAVVLATSARDVAQVMRFAVEQGLRVAVQATGHGALPVEDDTILVSTSWIDRVHGRRRRPHGPDWGRSAVAARTRRRYAARLGPGDGLVAQGGGGRLPDRRGSGPAGALGWPVCGLRAGVRSGDW